MKIEEEINYDEKDKQKKMVNTRQPVAWLKLTESSLTVSCSAFAETMVELHIFTIRIISILLSVGAAALSSNSSVPQQPTNKCPRKILLYFEQAAGPNKLQNPDQKWAMPEKSKLFIITHLGRQ